MRQRLEEGHKNAPTDGGRVKKCEKTCCGETRSPSRLWFHEEPSLCCVLYREGGKNKVGLPETVGICKIVSSRTNIMFTLDAFKMYSIQKHGISEIPYRNDALSAYKLTDTSA